MRNVGGGREGLRECIRRGGGFVGTYDSLCKYVGMERLTSKGARGVKF